MIGDQVKTGDLLDSNAQTLVNTVNTVGVMGKGIALEFKKRFPDMYEDYVQRCNTGQVRLGEPYLYRRLLPPWILNFPTKAHWRSVSSLADIVRGLEYLEQHYEEWGVTSLAVPPLGCGNGGLEWRVVGPTLYRYLDRFKIPVELYAPYGTPPDQLEAAFLIRTDEAADGIPTTSVESEAPRIQPGWIALIEILRRIEREHYHRPVGRTMFQKIAYFATLSGIPTGLEYQRGSYGPFAPELKSVMTRLVNNGLIREKPLGNMFAIEPGLTYDDARAAYADYLSQWAPVIERLTDLFLRVTTTDQAEVAATVHFAARTWPPGQATEVDVLAEVMKWKQRRRPPLDSVEVANTIRNLAALGWLTVKPSADLPVSDEVLVP
jgi:O-acetyl-ADP-ribose deacetylase (regulator of RNase III)